MKQRCCGILSGAIRSLRNTTNKITSEQIVADGQSQFANRSRRVCRDFWYFLMQEASIRRCHSLSPSGSSQAAPRTLGVVRLQERPSHRRFVAALCLAAALPVLAGCTLLEGPTPETPEREVPERPETSPEFIPDGSAEENLPFFTEVIRDYAEGEQPVRGEPFAGAIAEAGFDPRNMQMSFDQSQTGYEADSIFVSVLIDSDCLVGQLVADDRSFVAEAVSAVGPKDDICLLGETRPVG